MSGSIWSGEVQEAIDAAKTRRVRQVAVGDKTVAIDVPFASPRDWRDRCIYFLMVDRFSNPAAAPRHAPWDGDHGAFQGGTFEGIRRQLGYLAQLGVGAIWLTPVFKNCPKQPGTYHGYGFQDLLAVDPRFGTEAELRALVDEAHARGLYIIFDIVLNHAGDVFAYEGFGAQAGWRDYAYAINWRDETGAVRPDWTDAPAVCHADAAVFPEELRHNDNFRRQGRGGELGGDFASLKELVTERQETDATHGCHYPVRNTLIRAYEYVIAAFDVDGYRIDTLKYVRPEFARIFGNAMREFALSIGKRNFFTFGEVWDNETKIKEFIGRNASEPDDLVGVDAALDFPLFSTLSGAVKGWQAPSDLAALFEARKETYRDHVSSHGEASRYFVTFLDNHDQESRFYYVEPGAPHQYDDQLTQALGLLFSLQGIPCVYYGTEQGLHGHGGRREYVREALWGKPGAFDDAQPFFKAIQGLAAARASIPALRYGRQYFRSVSGNGIDFGRSYTRPGVVAFSRILSGTEVVVVANTSTAAGWRGHVIVDFALNPPGTALRVLHSNKAQATAPPGAVTERPAAEVRIDGRQPGGPIRTIEVDLEPMEIQILGT